MAEELLGYVDPLSVRAGEAVRIMVSTSSPTFEADVLRLIHADESLDGPGRRETRIETNIDGTHPGRLQETHPGSFGFADLNHKLVGAGAITTSCWICPSMPSRGWPQGVLCLQSNQGHLAISLDAEGRPQFRVRAGEQDSTLTHPLPLSAGSWHYLAASYDAGSGIAKLLALPFGDEFTSDRTVIGQGPPGVTACLADGLVLVAALSARPTDSIPTPSGLFNGRLSEPFLASRVLSDRELEISADDPKTVEAESLVAMWSLGRGERLHRAADMSGHGLDLKLVNHPDRGVRGPRWSGRECDPRLVPDEYLATHFHEDDLSDCRWSPDLRLTVPHSARSGFHAVRLRAGSLEDRIPFFVVAEQRSARSTGRPRAGFLVPTMTYVAYGNHIPDFEADTSRTSELPVVPGEFDRLLSSRPDLGRSTYERHIDGSGICYATWRRPLVNVRPNYRDPFTNAPRHLGADLYMVDWLEEKGFPYEVITDHQLHAEGRPVLDGFRTVITGSHPEYWTASMRQGLCEYLGRGGRLMYLGGNGFYWVTGVDPHDESVLEVRRGFAGTRFWSSHPGEVHLITTGELGGLWRHRGRPPNSLVGVGFSAMGWPRSGPGYVRCPDSFERRAAFVFEGIGADDVIGGFGLVMESAVGDEIDRYEADLDPPHETLLLATSAGRHSDFFHPVVEDLPYIAEPISGSTAATVRADMVLVIAANGSLAFSVGSMNWMGALSHNDYDNNVSRITENVLRRFLAD